MWAVELSQQLKPTTAPSILYAANPKQNIHESQILRRKTEQ